MNTKENKLKDVVFDLIQIKCFLKNDNVPIAKTIFNSIQNEKHPFLMPEIWFSFKSEFRAMNYGKAIESIDILIDLAIISIQEN
jgi:hypothetical protein